MRPALSREVDGYKREGRVEVMDEMFSLRHVSGAMIGSYNTALLGLQVIVQTIGRLRVSAGHADLPPNCTAFLIDSIAIAMCIGFSQLLCISDRLYCEASYGNEDVRVDAFIEHL